MKKYSVYVLWSDRLKKRYVGCTANLESRVREHNSGKQRSTKGGVPWKVVYSENFHDLSKARKRETFLKGRSGRRFLDNSDLERCESG